MGVQLQGFGLVKENEQTKQVIDFDVRQATKLYNGLKSAKCLTGARLSLKSWANEFRLLRRHATKKEIKNVLNWYVTHITDEYTPKAQSAKKFRAKFGAIVEAMERSTPVAAKVKITDEARKIKARAAMHWPSAEERDELAFIQVCLDNYRTIEDKIKSLATRFRAEADAKQKGKKHVSSLDEQDAKLFERVQAFLPARCDFVRWWLEETNKTAHHWKGWSGQLMNWVLHENHPKVQNRLHTLISDYTSSVSRHDFFDKAMKECKC